jgi:hypothetical protein
MKKRKPAESRTDVCQCSDRGDERVMPSTSFTELTVADSQIVQWSNDGDSQLTGGLQ